MASDIGYADDDGEKPGVAQDQGYGGGDSQLPLQTLDFRYGRDNPGVWTTALGRTDALPGGVDRYFRPAVGSSAAGIGDLLHPAIGSALAAPPGALSRDEMIGRTADVLHQALAGGALAPERFGDLVGRSVDFLTGLPDHEAGVRQGLAQLAADHAPAFDPSLPGEPSPLGQDTPAPDDDGGHDFSGEADEDDQDGDPAGPAPEPEPAPRSPAAPGPDPAGAARAGAGAAAGGADFGELSRLEESGARLGDPGAVSNGKGDPGGVSYGSYQLAVAKNGPQSFLKHEGRPWAGRFQGLQAGTPAYSRVWRQIAATDRDRFAAAQKAFADRAYFQPQAQIIRRATGVDVTRRSSALQNAVFSTAVQHGAHTSLIADAVKQSQGRGQDGDAALIDAIYDERGRRGPGGVLVHFRSSKPSIQQGVAKRLQRERGLALHMLQGPPG